MEVGLLHTATRTANPRLADRYGTPGAPSQRTSRRCEMASRRSETSTACAAAQSLRVGSETGFEAQATRAHRSTAWSSRARRAPSDAAADRPSSWRRTASPASDFAARRASATFAPEPLVEQKRGGQRLDWLCNQTLKRNETRALGTQTYTLGPSQPRQPLARPTPRRRYPHRRRVSWPGRCSVGPPLPRARGPPGARP